MGIATQIRNYRVRAGRSREEVAGHLGINNAWYDDLERYDEELTSTLTLFQATALASFLGVGLSELVSGSDQAHEAFSIMDLPSRIRSHLEQNGISVEQFEEELGWDIREFLESPLKVAAESPIMFLQGVSEALGIDWLAMVPDDHAV
jgi:transcriptional regulator with XRE-family HTH domain